MSRIGVDKLSHHTLSFVISSIAGWAVISLRDNDQDWHCDESLESNIIDGDLIMAARILLINFKFSVSKDDYRKTVSTLASAFAEVEGLRWKIWTIDEAQSIGGGIYLFDDEGSLTKFLEGPLAAQVKSHPAFSELSAASFDVIADATAVTRGPA